MDCCGFVPKFPGILYYVGTSGDDANDGKSPDAEMATIGAAIDKMVAGDALVIGAKTYTET
jgi:hypothetical protein